MCACVCVQMASDLSGKDVAIKIHIFPLPYVIDPSHNIIARNSLTYLYTPATITMLTLPSKWAWS